MAIPLYLCNSMALLLGGKTPVDLGRKFIDGQRILGEGKTFRGTAGGIAVASAAALALGIAFPETSALLETDYFHYGFLLAVGAVAGDFAGSFAKRRAGIERGKGVFMLDQLDFVVGGLALGLITAAPTLLEAFFLLAFTMLAHVLGNWIAFAAKVKQVPW